MKKIAICALLALFLAGCGGAEFMQHDALYKDWDHMKFSWFGYKSPTAEDIQNSKTQDWWGAEVPYVPGQ